MVKVREAEKQFAETTYQRWRDSPKGVVSQQEQEAKQADFNSAVARLNAAVAQAAAAEGEVDRLQALESFKKIVAPFDGAVTARETDIGALINAGSGTGGGSGPELFRVGDIHRVRIFVQVPQQLSAEIKEGLRADMHLPQYPDKTFKTTVATTSSAVSPTARTLLVELHADNPDTKLQPGAYSQVDFELPSTGETKTAWVVDYVDQQGRRRLKTFALKKAAYKRTNVQSQMCAPLLSRRPFKPLINTMHDPRADNLLDACLRVWCMYAAGHFVQGSGGPSLGADFQFLFRIDIGSAAPRA
jgi:multidrug efflux pump subunit AcrA (membrane-fusion protein)